jgi:cephalosporin-C deacetylase-like acetyl esterase
MGMMTATLLQVAWGQETLPVVQDAKAPQTFEELWSGYDPRKEPLETEVLKEWEEDGVVLRVVRFRVGIFKGQKAMLAGVYGFPKGGTKLPGLLQIHGGGQYADYKAPLTNAKRGYATLSIAWAGRISAPGYVVTPDIVQLFWDNKTTDPKYKLTTDWGALDAYHAPCRNAKNQFANVAPQPWTLDVIESPRNNPWFLCTLAARRALTFLEQQPEVNPDKLGVYGHSMGGKLTVMTTGADARVKASAPSCGGVSDRNTDNLLYNATLADNVYLKRINCPIIFLSPANDFHGHIDDLQKALDEIASQVWRVTCAPHHNHQDTEPYQVAGPLWFDQYLKNTFTYPATPESTLTLKTATGVPSFSFKPDTSRAPLSVDVFYTQQGQMEGEKNNHENTMARFWHCAKAQHVGDTWTAELPLLTTDKPLWVYANVQYALNEPVIGAGYYYGVYTAKAFNLSSRMAIATPAQLKAASVNATDQPSHVIETFETGWQKEWFTYELTDNWARKTHKLYDLKWQAPEHAALALDVRCEQANKLVIGLDNHAAEIQLKGNPDWQSIVLTASEFRNAIQRSLPAWKGIRELRLGPKETLRANEGANEKKLELGGDWQGLPPEFRNLRWLEKGTFGYDAKFVSKFTETITLTRGDAQVLLAPAYQGRVMTSTSGGAGGASYGWLNYSVIEKGVLKPDAAKGKLEEHIYVFGGEERFWLGPEGGQYALFFAPGADYTFDNWRTPPVLDTEPFTVVKVTHTEATFAKTFALTNRSGTLLSGDIRRTVRLLDGAAAAGAFGITLGAAVKYAAYETDNALVNTGDKPWTPAEGLLSIWLLGMYKPTPNTTIVIPFMKGAEAVLGPKLNDTYFGKVPPEHLIVKDGVLFFRGDGTRRGKIGISPQRSLGIAGSYDADSKTLNLVTYNRQPAPSGYVNSMWETQKEPYAGDVLNAYNDGSPGEGKPPLGPFYELETSSPAALLKPGGTLRHVMSTIHLQGPEAELNAIAKAKLGVSLSQITGAFVRDAHADGAKRLNGEKMGRTSGYVTPHIAYGNHAGLLSEQEVPDTLKARELFIDRVTLSGKSPWWVAFPGAKHTNGRDWGTGSRALVIRSYKDVTVLQHELSVAVEDRLCYYFHTKYEYNTSATSHSVYFARPRFLALRRETQYSLDFQ